MEFGDGAESLGHCVECGKPTAQFVNCANDKCRKLFLRCDACTSAHKHKYCGECEPALV